MYKSFSYFKDAHKQLEYLAALYSKSSIAKYVKLSNASREDSLPEFIIQINKASKSIYDVLNKSIISGDYIIIDEIEKRLNDLKFKINDLISISDIAFEDQQKSEIVNKLADDLQSSFSSPVLHSISQYKLLLSQVKYKLSSTKAIHLFDVITDEEKDSHNLNPLSTTTHSLSKTFAMSIQLARIDHNIAIKKEYLEVLSKIQKSLEISLQQESSNDSKTILSILIDKCNYLLFKILYRLKKDKKNFLYIYNYKDKELDIEEIKASVHYLKPFLEHSEKHYSSGNRFDQYFEKQVTQINEKLVQDEELNISEYHTLINYYKDHNKSIEQVNNLTKVFSEGFLSKRSYIKNRLFDYKSYKIAYNYILNNSLSLQIYKKKYSAEFTAELERQLDKIALVQQETFIYNYFPYYRVCMYFLRTIKKELKEEKLNAQLIQKLITKLEINLKKAFENFEWCKDKDFLAYQLPKKECTIMSKAKHNGSELPIFLASSFILPLNYEETQRELESMYRELDNLKSQSEIQISISEEKEKIRNIRDEINQHDRKQIEILSIFAAIVLFAIGNIQLYSNVANFSQAILFTIAFAYSLGLFVICIWIITRNNSLRVTVLHWFVLASYVAFSIYLFYAISKLSTANFPKKDTPKGVKVISPTDSIESKP